MKICLNDILYALSFALDAVEQELSGITTNHGKRTAWISAKLGFLIKLSDNEITDLASCAILHDNALSEYIQTEYLACHSQNCNIEKDLTLHCIVGEKNLSLLPLHTDVKNVVLYHHENADGSGPFGKTSSETPLKAQIIHLADSLDSHFNLDTIDSSKYREMTNFLNANKGSSFDPKLVDIFTTNISLESLENLSNSKIDKEIRTTIPRKDDQLSDIEIRNLATLFARIIDCKSHFTCKHSLGVADKVETMARWYKYSNEKINRLYFAGALHDIGKLVINNDILEKPQQLTDEEFKQIRNHAFYTYAILRNISGMNDITAWASHHHEKLNGTGYPFGMVAEQLSTEERLMCCVDIYQALTEDRPYKKGLSHNEVIKIMRDMADKGEIDRNIVEDMNTVFK